MPRAVHPMYELRAVYIPHSRVGLAILLLLTLAAVLYNHLFTYLFRERALRQRHFIARLGRNSRQDD